MRNMLFYLAATALCLFVPTGSAPAAEEYRLSLNLPIPPIHNRWHHAIKPWFDELTERSGGRIVVEPYFAEALSTQAESLDSVRNGLADFTESAFGYERFPFHDRVFAVCDLSRSMDRTNDILHAMEKSFPQVMDELGGVKLLFTHSLPVGMLIATRKPVTRLDDLKGMKIAVIGGMTQADRLKALGASVVSIPVIDIYMALQQGIIDGSMADFQLLTSRRFGDILKHVTLLPLNSSVFYCCMNQDVYDGMPADLRALIDDMSGTYAEQRFEAFWNEDQYSSLEEWRTKMGGTLHLLSDEDYARANELVKPVEREWVETLDKAGYPGADMLRRFHQLEAEYNALWKDSRAAAFLH